MYYVLVTIVILLIFIFYNRVNRSCINCQEWNDNRLTWDPSAYDQLNFTLFEHREIWHPDFMAYNK